MTDEKEILSFRDTCDSIFAEISKDIIGQEQIVRETVTAIIAGGNVLLEGVPGLGKTRLVRTLGRVLDMPFSRIQFTPDLMPADVTGTNIVIKDASGGVRFEFRRGPVFSNIVLADEINRATPKTQSALLEAMQERQVTIGDNTFQLDEPFLVMATQNPIEQEGTYPLPEAQVDRFLMKVVIGYPNRQEEKDIIRMNIGASQPHITPLVSPADIVDVRNVVKQIYIDEKIERYIVDIVFATRFPDEYGLNDLKSIISFGSSPRASISMALAARAYAFLRGRGYVIPEDVRAVCHDVMRHRLGLSYEAEANNITADEIISNILDKIAVP